MSNEKGAAGEVANEDQNLEKQEAEIRNYLKSLTGEVAEVEEEVKSKENPEKEAAAQEAEPEDKSEVKEEPKEEEAKTEEEDWWKKEQATKEAAPEDWKAELEQTKSKLSKYESKEFLKKLAEVADAPGFDFDKFLEAQVSKRVDYTQVSLENLYKASLEADTLAGYTEDDIDALWGEKESELAGKPHAEKALKAQLVKDFQSKESQTSQEEHPVIKSWKEEKELALQQQAEVRAENERVKTGVSNFTKSLVGKQIAGYTITAEDAAETEKRMDVSFYKKADGKIDEVKLGLDRTKAALFDKMVDHLKKTEKKAAVKAITRANTNHSQSSTVETDGRSEAEKVMADYAKSRGKHIKDFTN